MNKADAGIIPVSPCPFSFSKFQDDRPASSSLQLPKSITHCVIRTVCECRRPVLHTHGLLFDRICWPNGWHVSLATGRKALGKGRRELLVNYCLASMPVFVCPSPWVHFVEPLSQKVSTTPFRARAGNRRKHTGLAFRPTQNQESWQLTQKINDSTCNLYYSQTEVTKRHAIECSQNQC